MNQTGRALVQTEKNAERLLEGKKKILS